MAETTFDAITIGIASPEEIRKWSRGEVKKPETINYRTFKPEPDGLFCERIFGPVRDWQCHCGKYKKVKFKGIICDKCGVEVTTSKVRRRRMGHIELAAPVCHLWYLKTSPSPIALLLGLSPKVVERVVYFVDYIVTHVDRRKINAAMPKIRQAVEEEIKELEQQKESNMALIRKRFEERMAEEGTTDEERKVLRKQMKDRLEKEEAAFASDVEALRRGVELLEGLQKKQLLTEEEYRALQKVTEAVNRKLGKGYENLWRAGMGAEAIRDLLAEIDLEQLSRELRREIKEATGPRRAKAIKRLRMVEAFRKSKNRPEWMILEVLPVLPPDLRPMVPLDGGRFATSDLNDLYRRIINRNNRLKKIMQLRAPETIINHEKRLLQEAVDALIDNSKRRRPILSSRKIPLKSLSDMLRGKQGRFRRNLLGKRVDYSARAVIVPGPELKLHQCGIPKEMALELFKPFVMKRLVDKGVTTNIKTAKRWIERQTPEVWEALEEVIKGKYVLLNRAPTLHRPSIQAFEPVLVEGKAIKIHPVVCPPFNADFDGDAMAVHLPLSWAAQAEARLLMLSSRNIMSPANGKPLSVPIRDMVLGCYYLTLESERKKEEIKCFSSPEEAILAWEQGELDLHEWIKVRIGGKLRTTTTGRLIFNQILPDDLRFKYDVVTKKEISALIAECFKRYGVERTAQLLDDIKELGFKFSTLGGISMAASDLELATGRDEIFKATEEDVGKATREWERGRLTEGQRRKQVVELWQKAYESVAEAVEKSVSKFNPVHMMIASGARGGREHLVQLMGMRGLMRDAADNLIEDLPIRSNLLEGHTILEYFVSTYGGRKGLADTAVRTAFAGYLTRRLVDVAQEVIVRQEDCGTVEGIYVKEIPNVLTLEERIRGRIAAEDIVDPRTGKVIVKANEEITDEAAALITRINEELKAKGQEDKCIKRVKIRSPLTCETPRGVCAKCYGRDLSTGRLVEVGEAVGIVAAQSIGEPGTQLTLRTFHVGGVVGAGELVTATRYGHGEIMAREEAVKTTLAKVQDGLKARPQLPSSPEEMLQMLEGGLERTPFILRPILAALPDWTGPEETLTERAVQGRIEALRKQLSSERELLNRGLRPPLRGLARVEELFEARATPPVGAGVMSEINGVIAYIGQAVQEVPDISVVEVQTELSLDDPTLETVENLVIAEPVLDRKGNVIAYPYTLITPDLVDVLKENGIKKVKARKLYLVPVHETALTLERLKEHLPLDQIPEGRFVLEEIKDPRSGKVIATIGTPVTDALKRRLKARGIKKIVVGTEVRPGDVLTEGPLSLQQVLRLRGIRGLQEYVLDELQKEYRAQGADINDKHFEIILRQMLRRVRVKDPGDTEFLPGDIVDKFAFREENERVRKQGGKEAVAEPLVLGIRVASLATESFLAAASFEMTTRVLTEAACAGKRDPLVGLKENVIIGRLIPAGTGFEGYQKKTIKPALGAKPTTEGDEKEAP